MCKLEICEKFLKLRNDLAIILIIMERFWYRPADFGIAFRIPKRQCLS